MSSGGDGRSSDGGGNTSQEIDSVRELNRLLESALRMGDNNNRPATVELPFGNNSEENPNFDSGYANSSSSEPASAASWRLDTARRLSSLLSSQTDPQNNEETDDNQLLPALKRQSRYWIPLLLSWLKGGGSNDSHNDNTNSLDLPFKQRRHQRQKNEARPLLGNNSSSSSNSHSNGSHTASQEVQIEALRALTALTQWTASNEDRGDASSSSNNAQSTLTAGCSPYTPLSTSSQRLLLRHADAVPMIVSLLSSPDAAVHEQAVWILGSIASSGLGGASLPVAAAREAAAEMTKMMSENNGEGGDMSVAVPTAAAATSAGVEGEDEDEEDTAPSPKDSRKKDNVSARDVIFAAGAMPHLLNCLANNPQNVSLHRVGAWCLSSLIEGRYSSSSTTSSSSKNDNDKDATTARNKSSSTSPSPSEEIDVLTLLPTLKRLLHMEDAETLTFTCWTLSHLCDGPSYHIAAVIYSETSWRPQKKLSPANGLVPRLVELLLHPSPKVAKPALRTIGNIVCADCSSDQTDMHGNTLPVVDFTEVILECDAVPYLRQLIGHHNREIQKEACWTLSNIAAGTSSQIQAVIDSGAIPPLVDLVNNEVTDKEVRSEACWVVLNATSCGNDEQIAILIEEGCVSVLGVLLTEPNMVMMALEGIERVLQTEEAQDAEDLYHKSEEELGQRPTIIKCASLVKAVTESPHNSSAVSKRAKRIWDHHFVSCALCHNNYSRCRLQDSHFCNECKCHVCSHCDCTVYHLSYQEELWAEDDQKAAESKKQKKSKKAKKKQKAKEKAAEKKKLESQQQAAQQQQTKDGPKKEGAASDKGSDDPKANKAKGESSSKNDSMGKGRKANTKSSSPSRGTIESDAADSLSGADADNNGDASNNNNGGNDEGSDTNSNSGQPPIDLVSYLQQTGSIIALAKLLDSLYDEDYEDEGQQQNLDQNHRVLTTQ